MTEERERHIAERHPDLLPRHRHCIAETLSDPDLVRLSVRLGNARLFARWFDNLSGGKYVVVVVATEAVAIGRHWIVTAYVARKLAGGEVEWKRN